MFVVALVAPAWACGGFVTLDHAEALAASDAQQAIFEVGADQVVVEYRAHYDGNAADFGWIIPVPGPVSDVAEGDAGRFDALAELTAPQVNYWVAPEDDDGSGGCGCLPGRALKGGDNFDSAAGGDRLGVHVVGSGYAGDFQYTILDASDATALTTWLDAHGYDTTYADAPIAAYVADPVGFQWVAVQLTPDTPTTPEGGVNLAPLRITYGASGDGVLRPLFPARMGSTIQLPQVRNEMYVLGDTPFTVGNGWVANEDFHLYVEEGGDPELAYEGLLLSVGGSQQGAVTVWRDVYDQSGPTPVWLTRFDAVVAPGTYTTDMSFVAAPDADARGFFIEVGGYGYTLLAPVGLLGGLGAAWAARRRELSPLRRPRHPGR